MTPFEIRFVVGGSLEIRPAGDNLPDLSFDEDDVVAQFKEGLARMLTDELVGDDSVLKLDIRATVKSLPPTIFLPEVKP